jgi:hypothetical protein
VRGIHQKYIALETIIDYIHRPNKKHQNATMIWKETILYFSLIRDCLAYKVRNGFNVCLGVDPSVGSGMEQILP